MIILWTCALVALAVFAAMIYSIATFRPGGADASPPRAWVEIIWAIVPIAIMIGTALPAVRMLVSDDDVSIVQARSKPLFTTAAASSGVPAHSNDMTLQ